MVDEASRVWVDLMQQPIHNSWSDSRIAEIGNWVRRMSPQQLAFCKTTLDCFVAHGVTFINDLFANGGPARGDRSLWKQTKIGNNVSIGSNATILPVTVCSNVVIGAGSVVTKDISFCCNKRHQ